MLRVQITTHAHPCSHAAKANNTSKTETEDSFQKRTWRTRKDVCCNRQTQSFQRCYEPQRRITRYKYRTLKLKQKVLFRGEHGGQEKMSVVTDKPNPFRDATSREGELHVTDLGHCANASGGRCRHTPDLILMPRRQITLHKSSTCGKDHTLGPVSHAAKANNSSYRSRTLCEC